MWQLLAHLLIRHRLWFLGLLLAVTAFMFYHAQQVQITYSNPQVIPTSNPRYADYVAFKKKFGEDGNVLVLGFRSDSLFTPEVFYAWQRLGEQIARISGVEQVWSLGQAFGLRRDTAVKRLVPFRLFPVRQLAAHELDSLRAELEKLPFYKGLLYNPETQATLMAVRLHSERLNSKEREVIVQRITDYGAVFSDQTGIRLQYSGMPLIRTVMTTRMADELQLFLVLAAGATLLVLLLVLRSGFAVVASMLVVAIAVIWTLGTIHWLGYEVTILTGLIPPLVVVISITNCMYLLNKYHIEYVKHGNQVRALARMVEKIGLATLFTNVTAAIGFGVFSFTRSQILKEFGLVAGLNIAAIFLISIILIPCFYSFVPEPKPRHVNYLETRWLRFVLRWLEHLVFYRRRWIFAGTAIVVVVALFGVLRLKTTGYIVDDIPQHDQVFTDLKFFEQHFRGVMPFEVLVETRKKGGVLHSTQLRKINQLQDSLGRFAVFSRPLSVVEGIKFARQAYFGGGPEAYTLPNELERSFVFSYLGGIKDSMALFASYVDSNRQVARVSMAMADVGTLTMDTLLKCIEPMVTSIFDTSAYRITLTGASVVFVEGSRYIIDGLTDSLLLAFLLVALCMGYLFRSWRMIIFSLIPNLIPLIITAGIMGYFNIPLKPSTVLIFSIAFGIAVDNAIRFLAKYQQELHRHHWDIGPTVSVALYEAGISIIYTSLILFFGFIIFTLSHFGGTFYLGLLTSITLVVAMFNNLLLLPSLLLAMRQWVDRRRLPQVTPADHLDVVGSEDHAPEPHLIEERR
ncbi:MAG: MMPL family transporter [Chitinophagales bacterium]|nr:MMPL family transporter [Chitinophagales bacterium]MDW8427194.1 MMPL family transporter [Chitinophagales bacterium]